MNFLEVLAILAFIGLCVVLFLLMRDINAPALVQALIC